MKKAILVVSYGVASRKIWEKTIGLMVEEICKIYSEWDVVEAFSSRRMIEKWQEQGSDMMNETEALEVLAKQGYQQVVVIPTHLVSGKEYCKVRSAVRQYEKRFDLIQIAASLLEREQQRKEIAAALLEEAAPEAEEILILVGHGTELEGNSAYDKLQDEFGRLGKENVMVETLESIANAVSKVSVRQAAIMPLMLTAGKHAMKDINGAQEESAVSVLRSAGFTVRVIEKGIGELATIRKLYYNVDYVMSIMKQ